MKAESDDGDDELPALEIGVAETSTHKDRILRVVHEGMETIPRMGREKGTRQQDQRESRDGKDPAEDPITEGWGQDPQADCVQDHCALDRGKGDAGPNAVQNIVSEERSKVVIRLHQRCPLVRWDHESEQQPEGGRQRGSETRKRKHRRGRGSNRGMSSEEAGLLDTGAHNSQSQEHPGVLQHGDQCVLLEGCHRDGRSQRSQVVSLEEIPELRDGFPAHCRDHPEICDQKH